ncbi:MAG: four helix bundle protein [bacterium]
MGGAILQRHPYEDLRVWQNAIGFLEMIYHETASFPPGEREELGRRLRDAAIDWIYDLSLAHSGSQEDFVAFLKTYHRYRTRLIILLKLGFRVGLIRDHAYGTLEGDLMEQEKVVAHQIELLESGRGMHTGALSSRSAARSLAVADRDRRGGRGRDDRGGRDDRPPVREERPVREPVWEEPTPAREPDRGVRAGRGGRRPEREEFEERYARPAERSHREAPETGAAYSVPEPLAETPRGRRRAEPPAAEPVAEVRTERPRTGRTLSSREEIPSPAAAPARGRRLSTRDEEPDLDDFDSPRETSATPGAAPVRRRRRAAVAEAASHEAPTPEPALAAPAGRRRR